MLEGLADEEVNQYLQENLKIVPLFEIDVAEAISPYTLQPDVTDEEPNKEAIRELRQVEEALEREIVVSQCVKASQLEEVNLGTMEDARPVHIAKEMTPENKTTMITLLKEFHDGPLGRHGGQKRTLLFEKNISCDREWKKRLYVI